MQKRPPYLIRQVTRHGKVAWYCWKRPGPKIRIEGDYGSRAFMAAYRAALYDGEKATPPPKPETETLAALIDAYRLSDAWKNLAKATRNTRGNMLDRIVKKCGVMPAADVDRQLVVETRAAMSGPGSAKCYIDTMRGLYRWALEAKKVEEDPSQGVKRPNIKSEGWETWTEADVAAYEAKWPIGSRQRLWLAVLLYTGMRLGDAVGFGPKHILGDTIQIITGKTGTPVTIPLHKNLMAILNASPLGKRSFISMTENWFSKRFREACDAAGVTGSAHGLRKVAAVRLAEAGATVPELNAWFGWTGAKMASKYTEKADRARLARQAAERLNVLPPS